MTSIAESPGTMVTGIGNLPAIGPPVTAATRGPGPSLPSRRRVATGMRPSYFGHDEFAPYAPGLKSLNDAARHRLRAAVLLRSALRPVRYGARIGQHW
jgi:hypothetical protein